MPITIFFIYVSFSEKIGYLIAESAGRSAQWSIPFNVLANAACTLATSFAVFDCSVDYAENLRLTDRLKSLSS